MLKFVLIFSVLVAAAATFDYVDFQKKHCHYENWTGYRKTVPFAYVCDNFTLTKEDLDYMAENSFDLSSREYVLFKNCDIAYFSANFVSKFPHISRIYFENCSLNFKNPEVVITNSGPARYLQELGFHKCNINENLNLQAFESLEFLTIHNCTLQYSHLDEYLLPKKNILKAIVIDNVNVKSFHKGFQAKMPYNFSKIICTSCQLEEIDSLFYGMKQEVRDLINFDNNSIKKLPLSLDAFKNFKYLPEIHLSGNEITEPLLKRNHFESLKYLQILDLSRNTNITGISYLTFMDTKLRILNMSHVNLETLDKLGNSNLKTIDFSHNVISTIQQQVFEDLIHLKFLDLSNNKIEELQGDVFQDLVSLEKMHLNFNKICELPTNLFKNLSSLKVLDLSYNYLECLDGLDSLIKLQELHVQHNNLKTIPSSICLPSSLLILNVSYNDLDHIGNNTFSNTLQLTSLDMSCTKNPYLDLDKDSFQQLKSLRILKMAGKSISNIEDIFLPISVKELSLGNKKSTILNKKLESLVNLKILNLPDNNSQCIEQKYKVFIVNEAVKGGRVNPELWPLLEDNLLDLILVNPTVDIQFYETGTDSTGHRFIFSNEEALKWIETSFGGLTNVGENVKLKCIVDREELNKYEIPKAWVWIPKSPYPEEKVMGLLKLQNRQIDTSSWRIVKTGPKRPSGQYLLIEFSKESLKGIENVYGCLKFSFSRVDVKPIRNLEIEDNVPATDGSATRCERICKSSGCVSVKGSNELN